MASTPAQTSAPSQTAPGQTAPSQAAAQASTTLEAEEANLADDSELQPATVVNPMRRGAQMISDPAATGGKAAELSATGGSVRFNLPSKLTTGNITVQVQARAVSYNGNPVVALLRGTQELARQTISSATYAPVSFGTVSVSVGDRLTVKLVNGDNSGQRKAVVDYLLVDASDAVATPTPTPVPTPTPDPTPTPSPIPTPTPTPTPTQTTGINLPPAGKVAWDWQIGAGGDANIAVPAGIRLLSVDGFDTSAAKVAALKAQGQYMVCYLDVGSYEPGRPDSAQYPPYLKIQQDPDWPAEYFLDVTDVFKPGSVLATILQNRFKMCHDKGFDAVEPDNLQNDENVKGGKISTQQQIDFNGWVADQVHAAGLAVFQKNGPDKILLKDRTGKMMVEKFDGILNEQCQEYSECAALAEYPKRGKLALNAEYKSGLTLDCTLSNNLQINSIKRDLDLRGPSMSGYVRQACN